ncbi:RNA polymerase III subunit C82 [Serendipita sp. 396]|nr:RNA polymerase III subunit C82 [Serendipita sp. 396]
MPSRTSYFWYVDLARATKVVLETLLKTMANIMERKAAESEMPVLKTLLEARNRTDVAEDESLLTIPEKQLLQRWEEKMMKFNVLETRVDEAIFILRELPLLDA